MAIEDEWRSPLEVALWGPDLEPLDWAPDYESVEVVPVVNDVGTASIVMPADADAVEVLEQPGTRCTFRYRADPLSPSTMTYLLGGVVRERRGQAVGLQTRTFDVIDDFQIVKELLGWPNPAGNITQQGADEAYYTVTGPAETVVKTLIAQNIGRTGLPVTVAPSLGRGATISVSVRMHPIYDRAFPAVDLAGVILTFEQTASSIVVDVVMPDTLPDPLTESSGIVVDGKFESIAPTVTRAVVMGQGVGTARGMRYIIDPLNVEETWGIVAEVAVDARDTNDTATLDARGLQACREGAPRVSGSATLAETDEFRAFLHVNLGTNLSLVLNDAPPVTTRCNAIEVRDSATGGTTAIPLLGDLDADSEDARTYRALAAVQRRTRDLSTGW